MSDSVKIRRLPTDYRDIDPDEVICPALLLVGIIVAVLSLMLWVGYGLERSLKSDVDETNQKIETFNAFPKEQRELVKSFNQNWSWQDEDETKLEPQTEGLKLNTIIFIEQLILLVAIVAILMIIFIRYWLSQNPEFYLANFPLGTAYGWVLLILCLPVGWPFLCVSAIRMKLHPPVDVAEDAVKLDLGVEDVDDEEIAPSCVTSPREEDYYDLRVAIFTHERESELQSLNEQIKETETKIQRKGDSIRKHQRKLGALKAERTQLERSMNEGKEEEVIDRKTANEELEQIKKMRGVKSVTIDWDQKVLCVVVDIRVAYGNAIYDFGDYEVKFWSNDYSTLCVRSGVKTNATCTTPFYHCDEQFCFGDREGEISNYASENRIVEALTLMIDCMHSVNKHDAQYIPECFTCIKKRRGGAK